MMHAASTPIWSLFTAVAARQPQACAIEHGSHSIHYEGLRKRAEQLAELWQIQPGMVVGLELEKGIECIAGILACWSRGAAYAPLAPSDPDTRKRELVARAGINLWVTSHHSTLVRPDLRNDTLAYVIFTSGSTGTPKAVAVGHDGLVEVIQAQIDVFQITADARVLWMLSPLFDASLSDILTALLAGATLILPEGPLSASGLQAFLAHKAISHADIPPSYLRYLHPSQLSDLKTLVMGGELPPRDSATWASRCRIVNVYGPTEATICTSCKVVDSAFTHDNIGTPLPGVLYRICPVNAANSENEAPIGTPGELWIGGSHVARGYLHQTELTQERFVQGWYRTGDCCVRNSSGDYLFKGRLDRQIKLNGKLIAPEEIEAAISQVSGVARAHVGELSKGILAAAYEGTAQEVAVREAITTRLPAWMIPVRWKRVDHLPVTTSGKVSMAAIGFSDPTAPIGERSGWLQSVVSQVLGREVDMNLSLADNGGDSLLAMEVAAVAAAGGLAVAPEVLMSAKRLADLALGDQVAAATLRTIAAGIQVPRSRLLTNASQKVLVLGATGFLGSQVVAALRGNVPVVALVRVGSPIADGLTTVFGDVTRPNLGLNAKDYAEACSCTDIVNCSGIVNLTRDFSFHRPVNVDALASLLVLQAASGARIHQVSTLSVFVHTNYVPDYCSPSDPLSEVHTVYGGYAQSKFAAEMLLLRAQQDRPIHLVRPGLLTPHRYHPRWAKNDLLQGMIRGIIELGSVPRLPTIRFDVTPVDWAAEQIAQQILRGVTGISHLSYGHAGLMDLAACLPSCAIQEPEEWMKAVSGRLTSPASRLAYLTLSRRLQATKEHHATDLFQATGTRFCSEPGTKPIHEFLQRYVTSLIRSTP